MTRPLTARDVADSCGVELKTVHNWVERGLIEHFRTPGRHLRFRREHLEAFLTRQGGDPTRQRVLSIAGRAPPRSRWISVLDPYEGLLRAGLERPDVIVVHAAGLGSVGLRRYLIALRSGLPGVRVVCVSRARSRRVSGIEFVAELRHARRVLSSSSRDVAAASHG